jgi:hypothetical protein
MTEGELLSSAVAQSRDLFKRYLRGFGDHNHLSQAPALPNHVAWTLGHLAITLHRSAERFDGGPLPTSDFVKGGGASGDADHYDTEAVSFGSKPSPDREHYPSFARCVAIFDAAIDRMVAALLSADDAKLASKTKWGQGETTLRDMGARMVFHNGTHAGQLADLRRALGMGSIFA